MMRLLPHIIGIACIGVAFTATAWAGENIVLANGFRLHADRHEVDGTVVRVFSGSGAVEMPAATIAGYEKDEYEPEAATAPTTAKPSTEPTPPAQIAVPRKTSPADLADQAAEKYRLPDSFVRSVMKAESAFQPGALSPKGAIGLMQLMPDTARALGADPHDPQQNTDAGAQYLRELLAKYENDPDQVLLALAAYNAGPAAVDRYHGVPPYRETREYILRVLKNWDQAPAASDASRHDTGNK
jgi:soluble lytic murein transglycosylase-like protein